MSDVIIFFIFFWFMILSIIVLTVKYALKTPRTPIVFEEIAEIIEKDYGVRSLDKDKALDNELFYAETSKCPACSEQLELAEKVCPSCGLAIIVE